MRPGALGSRGGFGSMGSNGGAAIPSFVPASMRSNPPDLYVNLKTNQAWKKAGNQTVSADTLISVSRASAATQVDSLGNWSQVGSNILARSDLGASIWETRTNGIRNSTMVGAVTGSPGTMPTNWSGSVNSLTRTVVGTGTENGINYVDVRYAGTTDASGGGSIPFESSLQVAATYGQTWSGSVFCTLAAGSVAGLGTTISLDIAERNGAGAAVTNSGQTFVPAAGALGSSRITASRTFTGATTAFILPLILISGMSTGVAADFTLRIGWPQIEQNSLLNATVASAAIAAAGAGGVDGTAVYSVGGGTGTAATLNVTVTGGVITAINSVAAAGSYTVLPPSPAALTYVSGTASGVTGATVTLTPTNNAASAAASNPILTSGSAATRNAEVDTLVLTGLPAFGSAYSEWAAATPQMPSGSTVEQYALNPENTSANRFTTRRLNASGFASLQTTGGVSLTGAAWAQNTSGKIAAAVAASDAALSFNGTNTTSASGTVPNVTSVTLGARASGPDRFLNGNLGEFAFWFNQRVPNAQLQSTTQ